MSIFYIVGKPRGGKSLTAVKTIVLELLNPDSKRFIVTNIRLKLPELAEYLHKHCKHEVDLASRVRILEDDEAGEFWLYEPGRVYEQRKTIKVNRRGGSMDIPDFEDRATGNGNEGTLYVIDEVHLYFPAREWQKTGADCTYFMSQHGKLHCDVCLVTQHPDQCDKALRRLAQEYMVVRNLSREPVMGFRIGNLFRFGRCLNSPTSANPAKFDSGFMPLDLDLGNLYDTTQGVGIVGGLVPNNEKRGRSLWWLLIPAACVVVLVFRGPAWLTQAGGWAMKRLVGSVVNKTGKATEVATGGVIKQTATNSAPLSDGNSLVASRRSSEPPLYVTGQFMGGALFSDGRFLHLGEAGLRSIGRAGAFLDGKLIPWEPPIEVQARLRQAEKDIMERERASKPIQPMQYQGQVQQLEHDAYNQSAVTVIGQHEATPRYQMQSGLPPWRGR